MTTKPVRFAWRLVFAAVLLGSTLSAAQVQEPAKGGDAGGPWGKAVDGMVCRLMVQPKYKVGQPISAVIEIKNISDKKRSLIRFLKPTFVDFIEIKIDGPQGNVAQSDAMRIQDSTSRNFLAIGPGEIQRVNVADLGDHFSTLEPWTTRPARKTNEVIVGKHTLRLRLRSPKITEKESAGLEKSSIYHWVGEIDAPPVSFDLLPLTKGDLVVHEWGVFTVLNESKYANANRKEEWNSFPSFFYWQFPSERLRWIPSAWDKPIIYFYAKPDLMHLNVKLTFAEGVPVVWWPCAAEPMDNWPGPQLRPTPRPFRSLTWFAWLGDSVPELRAGRNALDPGDPPISKVADFPIPADNWLMQARLPSASRITVLGNDPKRAKFPGDQDRLETERFIYYDGLVPAPDYLHCEKLDDTSVTLRNGAKFDLNHVFVVDRRIKDKTGFVYLDGTKQQFKAGTTLNIQPRPIADADWPAVGVKQFRQALLEAGLFEPEADSVIKIWQKQLLESKGLVAFHILPTAEYDRMLPLDILPAPVDKPVRVGIAFHPNLEVEPKLAERVRTLLKDLDSEKYQTREAASKALLEIGPIAIGMLRAELSKDITLEMRRRMESVLDRVDATEWLSLKDLKK